jgi:hypothetical protein
MNVEYIRLHTLPDHEAYVAGLTWRHLSDGGRAEIKSHAKECGASRGVMLRHDPDEPAVGIGLVQGDDKLPRGAKSCAAMIALSVVDRTVVVIEHATLENGDPAYWMVAVSDGAVIPETDLVSYDLDVIAERVAELVSISPDATIAGSAAGDVMGEETEIGVNLAEFLLPEAQDAAEITRLGSGASPLAVLAACVVLALAGGAIYMQLGDDEAAQLIASEQAAEQERQMAIEAVNARLQGVMDLPIADNAVRAVIATLEDVPVEMRGWQVRRIECSFTSSQAGSCNLVYQAQLPEVADLEQLSRRMNIPVKDMFVQAAGSFGTVGISLPVSIPDAPVKATAGSLAPIIQACLHIAAMNSQCTPDAPTPLAMPNEAVHVEPRLQAIQLGRWQTSGPLERLAGVSVGAAIAYMRIRNLNVEISGASSTANLEGQYVLEKS